MPSKKLRRWTGDPSDIWRDNPNDKRTLRGRTALPAGYQGHKCPKCGSDNLTGAIITESADERDPNILCTNCGYWWD
jgi:DNA-directed RNA polymerase subunit RPC12/RpoP